MEMHAVFGEGHPYCRLTGIGRDEGRGVREGAVVQTDSFIGLDCGGVIGAESLPRMFASWGKDGVMTLSSYDKHDYGAWRRLGASEATWPAMRASRKRSSFAIATQITLSAPP